MSDWTKLQAIDAPGFTEDASGRVATARYYMLASELGAEPSRGELADAVHARVAGWRIDRVELVPMSAHAYQVVVTARPSIPVAASYERSDLHSQVSVAYSQESLLFSEAVMGLRALPANPAADASLAGVDYLGTPPVRGYVPVSLQVSGGQPSVVSWSTAAAETPGPCPFTVRPAWSLVGKSLRHDVATVTFFVRATFVRRYLDWAGVNDGTVASLPGRFRLPEASAEGLYAAGPQSLTPQKDRDGRDFYRVVRQLRRVPPAVDVTGAPLRWDPAKLGGPMTWQRSTEEA